MECLYVIETKMTFDEYKKFCLAIQKENQRMIALLIVCLLLCIGGIILHKIFIIVFALLYPILKIILFNYNIKKVFESNKVVRNITTKFEFYKDYFEATNDSAKSKINYNDLNKIIETKTNFYLMTSSIQGYIIEKNNIPEGLSKFIKGLNYINKK